MTRRGFAEPCWCGATDCPRCHPFTWWHDEDCDDMADCDCYNPSDSWVEP